MYNTNTTGLCELIHAYVRRMRIMMLAAAIPVYVWDVLGDADYLGVPRHDAQKDVVTIFYTWNHIEAVFTIFSTVWLK